MLGVLITPTSRGNVSISSADAATPPIINPNWLTTESDQQLAVTMFKRMRQAFQSSAMAPLIRGEEYNPGPAVKTDGQILEYIRDTVMTLWHPAGTCKMGTSDDSEAVIDSQARVFGVSRLRVVDASSFPFLPPGHPSSTVCKCSRLKDLGGLWMLTTMQICWRRKLRRISWAKIETWVIVD